MNHREKDDSKMTGQKGAKNLVANKQIQLACDVKFRATNE
jgi:hypothetical protein